MEGGAGEARALLFVVTVTHLCPRLASGGVLRWYTRPCEIGGRSGKDRSMDVGPGCSSEAGVSSRQMPWQ